MKMDNPWGPDAQIGQSEQPLRFPYSPGVGDRPQAQRHEVLRGQEGKGVEVMEALKEGEQLFFKARVPPVVPPPGAVVPGWAAKVSLGTWESLLCRFPVLQEVP